MIQAKPRRIPLPTLLFLLLPALVFAYFLGTYSLDAPYIDDFHLYNFLIAYLTKPTFGERLALFFTQTNEHRAVFNRLIVWVLYQLTGRIDLVWLMWVGYATLLGLLGLFGRVFSRLGLGWGWFVPVPFLLFQIQGWSNYYWGFCAAHNIAVIGWVALSLYVLRKPGSRWLALAIGLGVLATFTMGSGLMVFPAGLAVLSLQRRWRSLIGWLGGAVLSAGAYFYHYNHVSRGDLGTRLLQALPKWLTYLGNFTDFSETSTELFKPLCFFTGLLLVLIVAWRLLSEELNGHRTLPTDLTAFMAGFLAYFAGTAALVAINRNSMIENRYKINAVLFLLLAYFLLLPFFNRLRNRRAGVVVVSVGAILFFGYSYVRYLPAVVNFRQEMLGTLYSSLHTPTGTGKPIFSRLAFFQARGAYHLPEGYGRALQGLQPPFSPTKEPLKTALPGLRIEVDSTRIVLKDSLLTWKMNPDDGLWLLLDSPQGQVLSEALRQPPGLAHVAKGQFFKPGGEAASYFSFFNPGKYRIWVYVVQGGKPRLFDTGRMVVNSVPLNPEPAWMDREAP